MRGGSSRTWKSFDAVLVRVRRFRNDGRVAVTTMRAAPDCSSGTLCLPSGREMRMLVAIDCCVDRLAVCGAVERERAGTLLPFCSSAIVSVVKLAFGASAVTSSVAACPTDAIRFVDGETRRRPAAGHDVRDAGDASARMSSRPTSQRNMDSIIQVC